jgi:collagen type VII alpha
MKRAAKLCWLGLSAASSCVALGCTGNNATVGAMNDAGTAGSAGTTSAAGSAGAAGSTGVAGSFGAAGSTGIAGAAGTTGESRCAPGDFAADECNSCTCSDAKTWDCTNLACTQSDCPAARPTSGANCATTPTFAKDPTIGTCCPYTSTCAAPDGWARFASASACLGIDSGGCPAGFSDCNKNKQDGCETRTPVGTTCANACTAPDGGSASSNASPSEPCPTGTVGVVEVGGVAGGGGAHCQPIPTSCDGQPSCACMKYCSCVGGFGSRPESCSEQAGVIYCDNGIR